MNGIVRYCTRGCTQSRKHLTDCPDQDTCTGCLPREAEHGQLCYGCHKRLLNWIDNAAAQYDLLIASAEPGRVESLTAETIAKIGDGWRTNSDTPHQGPYARSTPASGHESEPVRLAMLDAAQNLADILSQWVEYLCEAYAMRGPVRHETGNQREQGTHGRWRYVEMYNIPDYHWTEPRSRFAVRSSTRWIAAQVERLEWLGGIEDLWAELGDAMSQAHALAPWRPEASRLNGIECPECHRCALVLYGGDEDVTCTRCNATISPGRYAIWVRELAARRTG